MGESKSDYDLIVVGGGSAGSACAAEAVRMGHGRVAVINDGELGGLCILRGCMPTKSLLHSVEPLLEARHAHRFGLALETRSIDFGAIMERKREHVVRFQRAKVAAMEGAGYELIDGRARFVAEDAVEVNGRRLTARAFLIATGSKTHVPPVLGMPDCGYLDSDSVLDLEEPPPTLLVLGTGAIGLEFSTFFAALGTEVTLIGRSPLVERGEEPDLSEQYRRSIERNGVQVYLDIQLEEAHRTADGVRAVAIDGSGQEVQFTADALLLATGRVAAVDGLDLEAAGIRTTERGDLVLDEALRTTNPRVFAAGDATGTDQILHVGNAEGRHVARNLKALFDGDELVPWDEGVSIRAIFTHPPYAQAGSTAREAAAAGHTIVSAQKNWANQGRGIVMGVPSDEGFIKLIADKGDGRILGCQILGPRADDLVHVISTVIHFDGTVDDLLALPWYHPTLSEAFIELARELKAQTV